MQPLGDKILVKIVKEEEKKTESGLFLGTVKNPYEKVEVIAVSPDSQTNLKKGDICLSDKGGVDIEENVWLRSEKLLVVKL